MGIKIRNGIEYGGAGRTDAELDPTSSNAISNQVVTNKFNEIDETSGVLEVLQGTMPETLNTDVYLPIADYENYKYVSIECVQVTHTNGNKYIRGIGYTDVKAMYVAGNVRVQTSESAFAGHPFDVVIKKYK